MDAAILAPCHFLTEPWRFYDAGPQTKTRLMMLNLEKLSKAGVLWPLLKAQQRDWHNLRLCVAIDRIP